MYCPFMNERNNEVRKSICISSINLKTQILRISWIIYPINQIISTILIYMSFPIKGGISSFQEKLNLHLLFLSDFVTTDIDFYFTIHSGFLYLSLPKIPTHKKYTFTVSLVSSNIFVLTEK
jgi:hypothetical protein